MNASRSTLVGVATGTPDGGVAVVRLSGPEAQSVARALAGQLPPPRSLRRRILALAGEEAELALVVVMPGPRSFTGEDVVELHVHAGDRNVRAVLEACQRAGALAAGPGDFSRRAFEHGRLSLEQAEGIAAVIGAQTDEALSQARRLAAGELGRTVETQREALQELRAEVEANLDFPEDVEAAHIARWRRELMERRATLEAWLRGFETSRRARERARVVLAGPTNAGKSSLFNALLGTARTLVADAPGTTRDYVEAELAVGRHGCVLVDTAGLRTGADAIEAAGIANTEDQLAGADVVLWIEAADAEPVVMPNIDATLIRVESKRDRGCRRPEWLGSSVIGSPGEGVEQVLQRLRAYFAAEPVTAWIGLARHRNRAGEALAAVERAVERLQDDAPLELVAFELGIAQARLGEITGRTSLGPVSDDLLSLIFSRFCIGK